MTEDEPRKMRCCGPPGCGTTEPPDGTAGDSPSYPQARRWCIVSECHGWRWERTPESAESYNKEAMRHKVKAEGFCGLAGKP